MSFASSTGDPFMHIRICVALFIVFASGSSKAEDNSKEEPVVLLAYSVEEFPVWRTGQDGKVSFDATILTTLIRSCCSEASWRHESAAIVPVKQDDGSAIAVAQTTSNHKRIQSALQQISAFAYDDFEKRLRKSLRDSVALNKRVLLLEASPNSQLTQLIFGASTGPEDIERLEVVDSYVVHCVGDSNKRQLFRSGIHSEFEKGYRLTVLDQDGSIRGTLMDGELFERGAVKAEVVQQFLQANELKVPDAIQALEDAKQVATQAGKNVLVQMSGPDCGPCIQLSRYFADHNELFSREYVHLHLDSRSPHRDKLIEELDVKFKGVPWMVIISAEGEIIATSEVDSRNIGFPAREKAQAHFRAMLKSTSRFSSEELDLLIIGLTSVE
ncbi:thioredoxin family protein [Rhodopirellula bahusiensis]|uniref:thioredoxin family protein n=2 Tax=Rhodopirellula bahusiensis TaxID=2014065 RepID=UPI00326428EC